MLQRAATNAYSWWWASHIRTKHSKWLEQNLQDMEEKVSYTLSIIDDDGDTFAKRAEMYYRKRPEIVGFVEEAFRSYRALAERYDHLSRELQSANRTIATAFPEHLQFPLDDDDDNTFGKRPKHLHLIPKASNIPKAPGIPKKGFRSQSMMNSRTGPSSGLRRTTTSGARREKAVASSGLSKEEALDEIDKLQKGILALQTEKEFVRSSCEHSNERYWGIENEIMEMQKRVCNLQDEFGIGAVIDDSEARKLMATTALNTCKETIAELEEKQKQSVEEARIEKGRFASAKEKFESLRNMFDKAGSDAEHKKTAEEVKKKNVCISQDSGSESTREWDKKVDSDENLSVARIAEKVDELVERVVSLETTTSSQTALINTLRSETDELHEHIRGMEEDKANLVSDSIEMEKRIRALEDELNKVKNLNKRVEDHNKKLQERLTEANQRVEELSSNLHIVKMGDEDVEEAGLFQEVQVVSGDPQEENPLEDLHSVSEEKERKKSEEHQEDEVPVIDRENGNQKFDVPLEKPQESVQQGKSEVKDFSAFSETTSTCFGTEPEDSGIEDNDEGMPNWRRLLPNGIEDREKAILDEYTSVLRDYREVKRKLGAVEKRNRDGFFELALQIRELKNAVAEKDVEIQSLRNKLDASDKNSPNPLEGNQSDLDGQRESWSISPISYFSVSTMSHQQGEDYKKTPARTKASEVDGNQSDLEGQRESWSISQISSSSDSTTSHQQGGDFKNTSARSRGSEVKVKFADVDGSPRTRIPTVEEKVRADIDGLLEENLEFWLRFSTSIHQIQKFQASFQDLKSDLSRLNIEDRKQDSARINQQLASEARPIYRHLREIRTELQLWLENSTVLREELQGRYTSMCNIQDEISRVTSHAGNNKGENTEISGYQAAKFQGEVLAMKQENKKVSSELQTGVDCVKAQKIEVEKVLEKMEQDLGISNDARKPNKSTSPARPRIPLRSFLFGVKLKKHKHQKSASSLFSCVSSPPSPTLQKQNSYSIPPENLPESP